MFFDFRHGLLENSRQSVWYTPFSSIQQKSGTFEYTYSSAVIIMNVLCLAMHLRFMKGGLTGIFVPTSKMRLLTGNNSISADAKPIYWPGGPSITTGLSEAMKLPLGLNDAVQYRFRNEGMIESIRLSPSSDTNRSLPIMCTLPYR